MSLNVSATLVQQAAAGDVDEHAFAEMIHHSLPYAWGIVEKLAHSVHQEGEEWANYAVAPPSEQSRAQLLRVVGEMPFGVRWSGTLS